MRDQLKFKNLFAKKLCENVVWFDSTSLFPKPRLLRLTVLLNIVGKYNLRLTYHRHRELRLPT